MPRSLSLCCAAALLASFALASRAGEPNLPLVFADDFTRGADAWQPTDAAAWKVIDLKGGGKAFSQFKQSNYKPPHRSPLNFALRKDVRVADFVLDAKVLSTVKDYDHRDMCLFFGYQDKAHYYYVHLGKKTDDRANQIFIVNGADRVKISTKTTPGTPWQDGHWHHVRVVRDVKSGKIEVYFDDLKTPAMVATDTTFTWGQVGIGSFDDTGDWTDVKLRGTVVKK
jgi:hypothetical protein